MDWDRLRQFRYSETSPPPEWPSHLRPISQEGLSLFALDPSTGDLYWDGQRVRVERTITLEAYQIVLLTLATIGTVLAGIHPFGQSFGWW